MMEFPDQLPRFVYTVNFVILYFSQHEITTEYSSSLIITDEYYSKTGVNKSNVSTPKEANIFE